MQAHAGRRVRFQGEGVGMAIDGAKIVHAIMEGSRVRDAKGIIPLFGVYLSLYFVQYYNRLAYAFEQKMGAGRRKEAETHLIRAAQECGYATFQGIRNSREWEDLVMPMIESKEDEIPGFSAIAKAFGWGDMEIKELVPEREASGPRARFL